MVQRGKKGSRKTGQKPVARRSGGSIAVVEASPGPCQTLIDRFCILESMTKPLSNEHRQEWLQIVDEMKVWHASDRLIQQFVRSKAECVNKNADLRAFQNRIERKCSHCNGIIAKDELAFFDMKDRQMHCLQCDFIILRMLD